MEDIICRKRMIEIVRREVAHYADVMDMNVEFYYVENLVQQVYAVIAIPHNRLSLGLVGLAVRIDDDTVIIERDATDRPLFEILLKEGIPAEQIRLAYEDNPTL